MPLRPTLLNEIRAALGGSIAPDLKTASAASDIFEAYVFAQVLNAARAELASIEYKDVLGGTPAIFCFRTSPGYISSKERLYTHAVITFPGRPPLEAHLGIRVTGRSGVLHECDVAVLHQSEAEVCRNNPQTHPRFQKVLIGAECKYYVKNIKLDLVRSFVGLIADLGAEDRYFIVNTSLESLTSVKKYLVKRTKRWEHEIVPGSYAALSRLRGLLQTTFKNFKAGK